MEYLGGAKYMEKDSEVRKKFCMEALDTAYVSLLQDKAITFHHRVCLYASNALFHQSNCTLTLGPI